jgi:hypothetical protein
MSLPGIVVFAVGPLVLLEIIGHIIAKIADDYYELVFFVVPIILHVIFVAVMLIFMHNLPLFRFLFWNLRLPF